MAVDSKVLSDMALFEDLSAEQLGRVSGIMHYMRIHEGETLTVKGEAAHTFFVILSGNFMVAFDEGRAFTLHEQGQIIGWSTVVTPFTYTGTAVALTDGEVLCLSADDFQELLQGDAWISDNLMKHIHQIVSERMPYVTGKTSPPGA